MTVQPFDQRVVAHDAREVDLRAESCGEAELGGLRRARFLPRRGLGCQPREERLNGSRQARCHRLPRARLGRRKRLILFGFEAGRQYEH